MENEVQAPAEEQVTVENVKQMLDIPSTASDLEVITVLVNLIAALQEKYESLLADAVELEDAVANRDLQDFSDFIDQDAVPFWKNQLLRNRSEALSALQAIRNRSQAPAPAAPKVIPLRNRTVEPRTTAQIVEPAVALPSENPEIKQAAVIRNRAHQICRDEKLNFGEAFARAEKELSNP